MNKQIAEIRKKYGEPMLRMAIDHVISVGTNNLKNVIADKVCAQILKETPENSIMTPEFSAELMRCAIELAQVPVGDILKYIQTDMRYDGVTVHPGIIVRFRQNATCHHIMTGVIPADTAEETLEDAVKAVEDKLEAYIDPVAGVLRGYREGIRETSYLQIHGKDLTLDEFERVYYEAKYHTEVGII